MTAPTNVTVLPGVERRDLPDTAEVPSAEVLQVAIDNGVTDVVLVGRTRTGALYVAGESRDLDHVVGRLMLAVAMLTGH